MKTPFTFAICVASLLAFSAGDLLAQTQRPTGPASAGSQPAPPNGQFSGAPAERGPSSGPAQGGGGFNGARPAMGNPHGGMVAVIDLNHVMNKYVKAQSLVEELQKDGMAADTQLRKDNAQIEALKEKLKDFKPGTQDFRRLEEEITQRISDLKVRASIEQRDFQERQMKAMYKIYGEISEEVKRYAQANGLMLVMDYSSDPVDPNVPATIQRAVSRPFVYQGGPDITDAVLNALNQRAVAARPAGGAGGAPPSNNPNPVRR